MAFKDLATSRVAVAPSPATSGTSLEVGVGHGTRFPAVPFYATIHPDGVLPTLDTAEIVSVTAKSTDTFTITRAQKGTTAQSVAIDWRITASIYAGDVDIHAATTKATPVDADEIPLIDSAASNVLKNLTWANLKTTIAAATQTLTNKTISAPVIRGWDGWNDANESWSYSSWDATNFTGVITVPTDSTTKYSLGMRVRISQATGGTKYFIVTKIAATAMTVYGGSDYTLNNETVSSPYYSTMKVPFGFPQDPAKWTVTSTDSSDRTWTTGITNLGSQQISIPIGSWIVDYQASCWAQGASSTAINYSAGLSTANNTFSDAALRTTVEVRGATGTIRAESTAIRIKQLTLTSATIYFFNFNGSGAATTGGTFGSTIHPTLLRAVCAYL